MTRGDVLFAFAVHCSAYIEEHDGKYNLFDQGKSLRVRSDAAKWVIKRLGRAVRSSPTGLGRRFFYVYSGLNERLFFTFAVRDNIESLGRDKLMEAVVEDAHKSVDSMIKARLHALPEPLFLDLLYEAKGRVADLFYPRKSRKRERRA